MPDAELQKTYDEIAKRGMASDPKMRETLEEMRRRGMISAPHGVPVMTKAASKARTASMLARATAEQGTTPDAARAQGVGPAVTEARGVASGVTAPAPHRPTPTKGVPAQPTGIGPVPRGGNIEPNVAQYRQSHPPIPLVPNQTHPLLQNLTHAWSQGMDLIGRIATAPMHKGESLQHQVENADPRGPAWNIAPETMKALDKRSHEQNAGGYAAALVKTAAGVATPENAAISMMLGPEGPQLAKLLASGYFSAQGAKMVSEGTTKFRKSGDPNDLADAVMGGLMAVGGVHGLKAEWRAKVEAAHVQMEIRRGVFNSLVDAHREATAKAEEPRRQAALAAERKNPQVAPRVGETLGQERQAKPGAVQIEGSDAGLLRKRRPEVGLQGVVEGDAEGQKTAGKGQGEGGKGKGKGAGVVAQATAAATKAADATEARVKTEIAPPEPKKTAEQVAVEAKPLSPQSKATVTTKGGKKIAVPNEPSTPPPDPNAVTEAHHAAAAAKVARGEQVERKDFPPTVEGTQAYIQYIAATAPKVEAAPVAEAKPAARVAVKAEPEPTPAPTLKKVTESAHDHSPAILAHLSDKPRTIDQVAEDSGLAVHEASAQLTLLELTGKVNRTPRGEYVKVGETPAPAPAHAAQADSAPLSAAQAAADATEAKARQALAEPETLQAKGEGEGAPKPAAATPPVKATAAATPKPVEPAKVEPAPKPAESSADKMRVRAMEIAKTEKLDHYRLSNRLHREFGIPMLKAQKLAGDILADLAKAETPALPEPPAKQIAKPAVAEPKPAEPPPSKKAKTPAAEPVTETLAQIRARNQAAAEARQKGEVAKPAEPSTVNQDRILSLIKKHGGSISIDDIAKQAGIAPGQAGVDITLLELGGKVRRLPGNMYETVEPKTSDPTAKVEPPKTEPKPAPVAKTKPKTVADTSPAPTVAKPLVRDAKVEAETVQGNSRLSLQSHGDDAYIVRQTGAGEPELVARGPAKAIRAQWEASPEVVGGKAAGKPSKSDAPTAMNSGVTAQDVANSLRSFGLDKAAAAIEDGVQRFNDAINHGADLLRKGVAKGVAWVRAMVRDLGDWIKPHIAKLSAASQDRYARSQKGMVNLGRRGAQKGAVNVGPILKDLHDSVKDAFDRLTDGQRIIFSPGNRSADAAHAQSLTRARLGTRTIDKARAFTDLENVAKAFDRMPLASRLELIDGVEHGVKQPDSDSQKMADTFRRVQDAKRDEIIALGRRIGQPLLENYNEDYFAHAWKQKSGPSEEAVAFGRRPLKGSAGFLKPRSFQTIKEGLAWVGPNGEKLELASDNPVDLVLMKVASMDHFIMGTELINDLKKNGLVEFSHTLPPGGERINDKFGEVWQMEPTTKADGTPGAPKRVLHGYWKATEPVARILNTYLDPGLSTQVPGERGGHFAGRLGINALKSVGNALNMVQLGLSGYHATMITLEAAASNEALALKYLANRQPGQALKHAAIGAVPGLSGARNYMQGWKMEREAFGTQKPGGAVDRLGGAITPDTIRQLQVAGGRVAMDRYYSNNSLREFTKAIRRASPQWLPGRLKGAGETAKFGRAAALSIPAFFEAAAVPLMESYVPRVKMGAFSDMARFEIERAERSGKPMDEKMKMQTLQRVWDEIDNRFGQMVYDNVFVDRTMKDIAFATTRAVGWNVGSARTLGGSATDLLTTRARVKEGDSAVSHKMAHTVGLVGTIMFYNAVYGYLHGRPPKEMEDYIHPMGPDGKRVEIPSYLKETENQARAAKSLAHGDIQPELDVAHGKINPGLATAMESLFNQDYFGNTIRNRNDPLVRQTEQYFNYLFSQATPFGMRNRPDLPQNRAWNSASRMEQWFGINPVKKGEPLAPVEEPSFYDDEEKAAAIKKSKAEYAVKHNGPGGHRRPSGTRSLVSH